jgi:DNA-directed RNA polymerase subunit RPC12/RpoP
LGVIVYKCINCGGPLEFKAETQNWICDYCLSEFTENDVRNFIRNESLQTEATIGEESLQQKQVLNDEFMENATGYSCQSCGAEIVTDENTAATFCYYCHNPTIIPRRLEGEFRPEKVIPFKLEREKATEMFKNWCKKKPLLPKFFSSSSQLEKLSGIYVPFWLFDSDTIGNVSGEAKKVRTYTQGDIRYTEIKYYRVIREGMATFKSVPADGSKKMDDSLMEVLEPYDYSELKDFSMSYLSGYFAEKYDMDENDVYERVSKIMKRHLNTLLEDTIQGYSVVNIKNSNVDLKNVEAAYVLLPVWMFTYQFKGKTYIFAMNGQTGKIAGRLPISIGRTCTWFGMISASVFGVLFLGGQFLW